MHDTKALEEQDVASIFITSGEFVVAAVSQARSLWFEATPIFTEHPIQDRTDEEMVVIADKAIDEIIEKFAAQH